MNISKVACLVTFSFLIAYPIFAQVELFPVHFGQVGYAKNLLNPSMQNIEAPNSFIFGNQFFTGAFSKIDNLFFLGSVSLSRRDSASSKHNIGLKFENEIEGEYISKPKYYASYTWHTRLSERYWVGAGINLGRAGYIYRGTNVSSLGSDSNWDGDVGLVLYSDLLIIGASCNQFFNSKILPKELYFRWARFYTAYVQKIVQLGVSSQLSFHAQNQFLPNRNDMTDIGMQFIANDLLMVGTNLYLNQSLTFLTGLKDISIEKHHFTFVASYNIPFTNQSKANVQSYELIVSYVIK